MNKSIKDISRTTSTDFYQHGTSSTETIEAALRSASLLGLSDSIKANSNLVEDFRKIYKITRFSIDIDSCILFRFVNGLWWESLVLIKDYKFRENSRWEKLNKFTSNVVESMFNLKQDINVALMPKGRDSNYEVSQTLSDANNHFERFKVTRGGALFKPTDGQYFSPYDEEFLAQITSIISYSIDKEISANYLNELSENLRGLAKDLNSISKEQNTLRTMYFDFNHGVNRKLGLLRMIHQLVNSSAPNAFIVVCSISHANQCTHQLSDHIKDEFLKKSIVRISSVLGKNGTLAYTDDNEFSFIITHSSEERLIKLLSDLSLAFKQEVQVEDYSIQCELSAGYSNYPACHQDPDVLIRMASIANYQARNTAEPKVIGYQKSIIDELQLNFELVKQLPDAIENEQFELYFLPIVAPQQTTDNFSSFQAQIHWNHESQEIIDPQSLYKLAENTGHMINLGYWLFDKICQSLVKLRGSYDNVVIAMYLSPVQLTEPDFVKKLLKISSNYNVSLNKISLELSSTGAMVDIKQTQKVFSQLKHHGFKLCIDKFYGDNASLFHMVNMHFDTLRIDKHFVKASLDSSQSELIGSSVIKLSHDLSLNVICEDIETQEELDLVKRWKTDWIQGDLVSKPRAWRKFFDPTLLSNKKISLY